MSDIPRLNGVIKALEQGIPPSFHFARSISKVPSPCGIARTVGVTAGANDACSTI